MKTRKVTAGELASDPDGVAPVSGCRCRHCGHNAKRDEAEREWYIVDQQAYCADCWELTFQRARLSAACHPL